MNVIGLDLGTRTGWGVLSRGRVTFGVQTFDLERGESPGMRFLRFRKWLRELVDLAGGVEVIAMEKPHHRGGYATQLLVGMSTDVLALAAELGIETMMIHTGTLKKWATGKGNASKDAMIREANDRFRCSVTCDDEADALLVLAHACEKVGVGLVKEPGE